MLVVFVGSGLGLLLFAVLEFTVVVLCCGLICWLLFRFVLLLVNSVGIVVYVVFICCWFAGCFTLGYGLYGYLFIVAFI